MRKKLFLCLLFFMLLCLLFYRHENKITETKIVSYNGNNLMISIDGNNSNTLPTSGNYYLVQYDCKSKDTVLEWNRSTHQLNVSNQNKKGGVSCFLDFQSNPKLADMPQGSYVAYTGNNGCSGNACRGQNVNYVDDTNMGYCTNLNYKFKVNGWRFFYSKDDDPYLISAGAPECMCSNSDGTTSNSVCNSSVNQDDFSIHFTNLNKAAVKYCNSDYSYGGVCDESTSHVLNADDFLNVMDKNIRLCYMIADRSCGSFNDLFDVGVDYWTSAFVDSRWTTDLVAQWYTAGRHWSGTLTSSEVIGVRPVLRLDSNVFVTGGSGTYEDPYTIANNSFLISDGSGYIGSSMKSAVPLTLMGFNVSQMCINVNSSGCSNYIAYNSSYTLNWSSEADGEKIVYVYYKDSAGNIVASMNRKVILDTTVPTNNSVTVEDVLGLKRKLTITSTGADLMCFSNTSNDSSSCTEWVQYNTEYDWTLSSGTGSKTVYAFFKDRAGNISSTTATANVEPFVQFTVTEDFADSTYDPTITVTDGATYPWVVSNGRFQSSNKGVASSTSTSTIQITPTIDSNLSFDYGISSEINCDKFTITLTGSDSTSSTLVDNISGIKDDNKSDISLTAGVTYTLTLTYTKDSSVDKNEDVAYIDNLVIISAPVAGFEVNEDFADSTYDPYITVSSTSSYPWTVSNGRFQSSNKNQNSTSSVSTIQFTPTLDVMLSFDYGVSSESNYDKLTIVLAGSNSTSTTLVNAISGTSSGSKNRISLTAGVTYTLTLTYSKDGSQSSGSDVGYIDNLVITSNIVKFNVNEDFADSTYDSKITVSSTSSYPWAVSNGRFQSSNQGVASSTSSSKISFTPTLDSTLSFDYGVSSESNYDKLTITLTGSNSTSSTLVSAISGTSSGSKTGVSLVADVTYTLTLSYTKDGSADKNEDVGYIDNLVISS